MTDAERELIEATLDLVYGVKVTELDNIIKDLINAIDQGSSS